MQSEEAEYRVHQGEWPENRIIASSHLPCRIPMRPNENNVLKHWKRHSVAERFCVIMTSTLARL